MDFTPKTGKSAPTISSRRCEEYPHVLQFYKKPPSEDVTLHEFEDLAVQRVKVLKAVDSVGIRNIKGSKEYDEAMEKEIKKLRDVDWFVEKTSIKPADLSARRRKDHLSHFILRLAYCKSDELRRWFIQQELDLFRYRFLRENSASILDFLEKNGLDYQPIPHEDRGKMRDKLKDASFKMTSPDVLQREYYKVPFMEVLELVRGRKVYLEGGYAYVPQDELVVIVLASFREHLSHALAITSRAVPAMEEDGRLLKLLKNIHSLYLGNDYSTAKKANSAVTADMINGLSKQSFPPCMQNLHRGLKEEHHLKHWGRLQYGLFLKGIGLSLEEALRFWKSEFTKAADMDGEKFDRQHSYNIRYNYGKEGKRADYTPFSCIKIITTNAPGVGHYHGCPFRHSDADLIEQKMNKMSFPKDKQTKVMEYIKGSHYQLACREYFKAAHKTEEEIDLMHPNQYYEESQRLINGASAGETDNKTQTEPRGVKIIKVKSTNPNFDDSITGENMDELELASMETD
ncbi:hypothetical protein CAPTEDRAFT_219114 [Capitella teleta]|uniref:DNA primase large subunit n=1 Tax=Capitella teleta TaxID=283909 RepID=R7UJZ4_CAPTE|nr:hypothetical protein CAPTEDRAFT_219114 [Capitella teleta]|eukprot:ELU03587.1 hypothetical protein CAPTEDRAFT_219114 [Capitella teleta]